MFEFFLCLVFVHFLFDYPLQGDFLSKAKNRTAPIPNVPWYHAMFAHTFMHGAAVWFVTGMWTLGVFEMIVHWLTDDLKCRNKITFETDQLIHISCKALYAYVVFVVVGMPVDSLGTVPAGTLV